MGNERPRRVLGEAGALVSQVAFKVYKGGSCTGTSSLESFPLTSIPSPSLWANGGSGLASVARRGRRRGTYTLISRSSTGRLPDWMASLHVRSDACSQSCGRGGRTTANRLKTTYRDQLINVIEEQMEETGGTPRSSDAATVRCPCPLCMHPPPSIDIGNGPIARCICSIYG